ncbi:MAG TPA: hypothetical protein VHX65_11330 [Pirellulales bacterium]|jgi:hypothetical protein|nr:hypothetical protein [Pirellulales bacterium]
MDQLALVLGEIGAAQVVFLLGLSLMIVVLLVRSRRYFRQVSEYQVPRADAPPIAAPSSGAPQAAGSQRSASAAAPPRDFERWEVAMHDLARDLSGQLDSKIRILELLIRESDKAAARLEAALARSRETTESGKTDRAELQVTAAKASQPPTGVPPKRPPIRAAVNATEPRRVPAIAPAGSTTADGADKPRFDRVYALADAGLSPATIASQIGSQVGEVELILGIRKNGGRGEVRGPTGE